jgi:hypothetical protein
LYGICQPLEAQADALIFASLAAITSRADKSDILTPWKLEDRMDREVYTASGVADPAVRSGQFSRAWNSRYPWLNSRQGAYPVRKVPMTFDGVGGSEGEVVEGED